MTPERARKIAQACADSWYGGAAGLNLKEAITQGILEALQETEGDLVATRAERDICRQELSAAQKTLNDHLLSEAAETMRADKATSELAAAQIIAATGHPSPCTLGPLCPYCEIERLRAELAAARALLLEARGWLDPWESRQSALRDRIDAALAGQRREGQ